MSWMDMAKSLGNTALEGAKAAANATNEVAQKAYADLKAPPTTITCSGCQLELGIPPEVFQWLCQSPSCLASGVSNTINDTKCTVCNQNRPPAGPPEVACGGCNTHNLVPTSNAGKIYETTKTGFKIAAVQTAEFTKSTWNSLNSMPSTITCSGCQGVLPVPPNIFDWDCKIDGTVMTCPPLAEGQAHRSLPPSTCTQCSSSAPDLNPVLACGGCQTINSVPRTNARKHLDTGVSVAKKTGNAVVREVKVMASAPTEFNCEHCNTALRIDGIPAENMKGDVKLSCGACNRVTTVPKTNIQNALRRTANSAQRTGTKVYFQLNKKPSVVCHVCQTTVPLKPIEGEQPVDEDDLDAPKRPAITCPTCSAVLQPVGQ